MNPRYYYDIETENWTTFVTGALWDETGECLGMYPWQREDDFIRRLLSLEGEVYAHNGGRFDHLWLLDGMVRLGVNTRNIRIVKTSAGIVSITVGKVSFRDTFRIFPMSLAKLTAQVRADGKKTWGLNDLCTCDTNCGGYCAIRRDASPTILRRIQQYCDQDGRELAKAVDHFRSLADKLQIQLGATVGSSAWKSARAEIGLDSATRIYTTKSRWEFAKESYYGGRVEIFRQYAGRFHSYDVNSMYPSRMRLPLPTGIPVMRYGRAARQAFASGMAGAYRARVAVPDSFVPPLPSRYKNRIGYPAGEFVGTWVYPELIYAENCGVRILRVEAALTFPTKEVIFTDWVERIYRERYANGKDSREGKWLKVVPDSVTGKFGSRCETTTIYINPDHIRSHGPQCGGPNECDGLCGGFRLVSYPGSRVEIYESSIWRMQHCAHAIWAAYITAYSRIELHQQMMRGGGDDVIYCDTDGIKCLRERNWHVGPYLGEWADEGTRDRGFFLAPKVYAEDVAGRMKVRAKGIPSQDWKAIASGKPIEYHTFSGGMVDGRFFARRLAHRTVTPNTGMRILEQNGITRAPSYSEFVAKVDGHAKRA